MRTLELTNEEMFQMITEDHETERKIKGQDNLQKLYNMQPSNIEGHYRLIQTTLPREVYWEQVNNLTN